MGRLIFASMFLSLISLQVFSQELSYDSVNKATYRLYQEEEWDDLIRLGKQGLRSGIDYYYLRMRMGIAYFNKSNYSKASKQFKKAILFSSSDRYAWEYYGKTLKLMNQGERLLASGKKVPPSVRSALIPEEKKLLDFVYFEGGASLTNNFEKNSPGNLMGREKIYAYQNLYGNNYYIHAGAQWRAASFLTFYTGYSHMNIEKRQRFNYTTYDAMVDSVVFEDWGFSKYYSFPLEEHTKVNDYNIQQHELYINAKYTSPGGLQLIPAFHWMWVSLSPSYSLFSMQQQREIAYHINATNETRYFEYFKPVYEFKTNEMKVNDFAVSLSAGKPIANTHLSIGSAFVSLNKVEYMEGNVSLVYYPFGNLNLYALGEFRANLSLGEAPPVEEDNKYIYHGKIGVKTFSWLWTELHATFGDLSRTTENNVYIINNNTDKVNYRLGANFIISISDKIELSLRYQYWSKESSYIRYTSPDMSGIKNVNYNYISNNIYGGIKWKL